MEAPELQKRFTYHAPPDDATRQLYIELRLQALELARSINLHVPDSREKSLAITKLEETVMWANAGIARNGSA